MIQKHDPLQSGKSAEDAVQFNETAHRKRGDMYTEK